MVVRPRLVAPKEERKDWPWHEARCADVPVSLLLKGDRRMEAENFLSEGFRVRMAFGAKGSGWTSLGDLARVWQPLRLKGIQVGPEFGTPFFAATQVLDQRPFPRKWLSLDRTNNAAERFVENGTILVTCSGSVGRATLAHAPHEGILISHDLLRVEPHSQKKWGWTYASLRANHTRLMMGSAQYGHIIKHLETSHLNAVPIVDVADDVHEAFNDRAGRILKMRNDAYQLTLEAENHFADCLGNPSIPDIGELGFSVQASAHLFTATRRFDAWNHNPQAQAIREHFLAHGRNVASVRDCGFEVWLPNRFKRIRAEDGVGLVESSALFEINPDQKKSIAEIDFGDPHNGRVQPGWLLMSRSGQVYGLLGSIAMATEAHNDRVVSDDVIRIAPTTNSVVRAGYLYTVLSHPMIGRPLVKSLAYGSSIPHIEPADVSSMEICRLPQDEENRIADLMEKAVRLRADADLLETSMAQEADDIVQRFVNS